MSGGGSQLVGYWYGVGMHMVLCHGPVDSFDRIMAGDGVAWSGSLTANAELKIDQPNLFGGEEREGGVQGTVDVLLGDLSQPCNDYLANRCADGPPILEPNAPPLSGGMYADDDGQVHLPDGTPVLGYIVPTGASDTGGVGQSGFVPAFRGVVSLVLRQVWLAAMNPYIKPWSAMVTRWPKTLGVALMNIGVDANPAAIIAETFVDTSWGLRSDINNLDMAAFQAAGQTLFNEGFGMSLTFSKQQTADDFIAHVLSTVDGYRYTDPTTGKLGIRLARADYIESDLLVLDDTNIVTLQSFARPDPSDIINQVTVNFIERPSYAEVDDDGNPTGNTILKNVDRSITVHNGASIDLMGGQVNATSIDYPGISNIGIASRVAMRELTARSGGLATVKFIANRFASQLKSGDVFVLNWPPLGIVGLVLRVLEVDYGLLTDGRITVSAVQDKFNLPTTTYVGSANSGWVDPIKPAQAIANSLLFELPYYLVETVIANHNDQTLAGLPEGYAYLGVVAKRVQQIGINYSLWENGSGQYKEDQRASYTPYLTLAADIDDVQTILPTGTGDLTNFAPDTPAILGDEIVWIKGLSLTTVTVIRGVMDTVPAAHKAGSLVWLAGSVAAIDKTVFLAGQSVGVKLQPRTARSVLALPSVVSQNIVFTGRAERPYPPGNVRVNGVYRPKRLSGFLATIEWSTRNRLTQISGPVAQTAGNIAPEATSAGQPNTFYKVTIAQSTSLTAGWLLVDSEDTAFNATSFAVLTPPGDTWIQIQIEAIRVDDDGQNPLTSFQEQLLVVEQAGYGVGYGNYYGGFDA